MICREYPSRAKEREKQARSEVLVLVVRSVAHDQGPRVFVADVVRAAAEREETAGAGAITPLGLQREPWHVPYSNS